MNLFIEDFVTTREEERLSLDNIHPLISNEMNEDLIWPISLEEVEAVVFGMKKDKAPKPNGFPIKFYQEFWEIVKLDLFEVV